MPTVSLGREFGQVLSRFRRDAGLSQEKLAFSCGFHPTYVSQLERGVKTPTLGTIFLLGRALGVPPSELVRKVEQLLASAG